MTTPADLRTDRRRRLRAVGGNGLDTADLDHDGARLVLTFLNRVPDRVDARHVRIDAPAGSPPVHATGVARPGRDDPEWADHLVVNLDRALRSGRYTVTLVELDEHGHPDTRSLAEMDRMFTTVEVVADPQRDPAGQQTPDPAGTDAAAADPFRGEDYLARDFGDLRRVLLDQVGRTLPGWVERHEPDLMVALLELLAHVGDELSYFQDAVATEAYLQTARRRISVARHGRLVGYRMHHGCHARAWISLETPRDATEDVELDPTDTVFLAPGPEGGTEPLMFSPLPLIVSAPAIEPPDPDDHRRHTITVRPGHNRVGLWAWGESVAELPAGTTEAVLVDAAVDVDAILDDAVPDLDLGARILRLGPGSVLVLEEVEDGGPVPPDPSRRHPVRLTDVWHDDDPLYRAGLPLLRVRWSPDDALPFAFQLRAGAGARTVARANTVLVGHGRPADRAGEVLEGGSEEVVLPEPGLTWSVPWPDPRRVAAHQALRIRDLEERWRAQLERWRRRAAAGRPLSDDERRLLRRQLGPEVAARFGFDAPDDPAGDSAGLAAVLAGAGSLLAHRRRRLADLAQFALASGPLREPMIDELREDWGSDLADRLGTVHPAGWGSAAEALVQDPRTARPVLRLCPAPTDVPAAGSDEVDVAAGGSHDDREPAWPVLGDAAGATLERPGVVVEVDDDDVSRLRTVPAGVDRERLRADYWVGNGAVGNVPAGAISAVWVTAAPAPDLRVRNPLPATGGVDPEAIEAARRAIPGWPMTVPRRALRPDQYAELVERIIGVRRAAARARWTGRGLAMEIAVQPRGGDEADPELRGRIDQAIDLARRIGHDPVVIAPDYRGIVLAVDVNLEPHAVVDEVRAAVARALGGGQRADGTPGAFHPDRQGFGGVVEPSGLVAEAASVPGVRAVELRELCLWDAPRSPSAPTRVVLGPLQIARLDDDPARPDWGRCLVTVRGGR